MIQLKRAYDHPAAADGTRVLVDRLWPRGVAKDAAKVDLWRKDLAPSNDLRKWFGHDPARWDEFQKRYRAELAKADLSELRRLARAGTLTLVYAARDEAHNNAVVLRQLISRGRSSAAR